jgi:hypothetical protein
MNSWEESQCRASLIRPESKINDLLLRDPYSLNKVPTISDWSATASLDDKLRFSPAGSWYLTKGSSPSEENNERSYNRLCYREQGGEIERTLRAIKVISMF